MYCDKSGIINDHYHSSFEPMKRMYVRVSNTSEGKQERKLVPIGWICPICHELKLDDPIPQLKGNYSKDKHK